jgi:hypothetical protein
MVSRTLASLAAADWFRRKRGKRGRLGVKLWHLGSKPMSERVVGPANRLSNNPHATLKAEENQTGQKSEVYLG